MRADAVAADAKNLGVAGKEFRMKITKINAFGGAARCAVFRVKIKNQPAAFVG
jgi:hypothetical protein